MWCGEGEAFRGYAPECFARTALGRQDDAVPVGVCASREVGGCHAVVERGSEGDFGKQDILANREITEDRVVCAAETTAEYTFQQGKVIQRYRLVVEDKIQLDLGPVVVEAGLVGGTPGVEPDKILGCIEGDSIGVDLSRLGGFNLLVGFLRKIFQPGFAFIKGRL